VVVDESGVVVETEVSKRLTLIPERATKLRLSQRQSALTVPPTCNVPIWIRKILESKDCVVGAPVAVKTLIWKPATRVQSKLASDQSASS